MTKRNGFTVVEMLVVIVILGILVSLSAFAFRGWQQSLTQRQSQSDLRFAATAMENAKNFGNGYPTGLPNNYVSSEGVTLAYIGGNATVYCIQATSVKYPSIIYHVDSALGKDPRSGSCNSAYAIAAPSPSASAITLTSMTISWGAVTGATNYTVRYGTSTPSSTASCSSSPCSLTGLTQSTNYRITVTSNGQYGSATSTELNVSTASPPAYTKIATAEISACATKSDNSVQCWGYNGWGNLGNGTTTNSLTPVPVTLAGKVATTIVSSVYTTCIMATDTNSYCWGYGDNGEVGNGMAAGSTTPSLVQRTGAMTGRTIKGHYPSSSQNCVIANDDNAYCWGYNVNGSLGNGNNTDSLIPVAVSKAGVLAGRTVKSMSTGLAGHHCVIANDDRAYCWGTNGKGQLGNGTTTASNVPVAVNMSGALAGKTLRSITVGGSTADSHTCAITTDNLVYCWGANAYGQLGNASTVESSVPVAVNTSGALAGKTIKSLATSSLASCVIASDDRPYCWGFNGRYELGNGATAFSFTTPQAVVMTGALAGKTVKTISGGGSFYCVIGSDDAAYCWGRGDYGQLGNGATPDSNVPVKVL